MMDEQLHGRVTLILSDDKRRKFKSYSKKKKNNKMDQVGLNGFIFILYNIIFTRRKGLRPSTHGI